MSAFDPKRTLVVVQKKPHFRTLSDANLSHTMLKYKYANDLCQIIVMEAVMQEPPSGPTIGMLIFPGMTQLDFTGPFEIFARIPNAHVLVLWKTIEPVISDVGLIVMPTMTLADCPNLDVIFVPGGPGQIELMDDEELISFVREKGQTANYVTSVCTGALILGAAGLLRGYKAATHWASMDNLELLGAKPEKKRIVVDRNRVTGGGVSAGIDFGLYMAAMLVGQQSAEEIQLFLEYSPQPPFNSGSPDVAPTEVLKTVCKRVESMLKTRRSATLRAAARLTDSQGAQIDQ